MSNGTKRRIGIADEMRRRGDIFVAALRSVVRERTAQDAKWGEQNHDPEWWIAILGEEFGEFCQAVLHRKFGGPAAASMREELVQIAALALAMIECGDRNAWWEVEDEDDE